jgi:membrane-associated phospholipid phosphatase
MHYPSDIMIGYVVGASVGMAVPFIHKKAKVWFR